jgi:hypothetical protein
VVDPGVRIHPDHTVAVGRRGLLGRRRGCGFGRGRRGCGGR